MDDAVTVAKKGIDVFDHGDWEAFRNDLTEDCVYREFASGQEVRGIQENLRAARAWHDAFPDVNGEITNAFGSGDQAVLQIVWSGTHTGALVGPGGTIPPTGRRARVDAVQVVKVRDGKIAATDHYFDLMTLLTQLGVMQEAPAQVP
jgi:steroid delta-isomerase-like uncharacterized protein